MNDRRNGDAQFRDNRGTLLGIDAWARSTVSGQTASVVYLTITSATPARLVGVSSPLAAVVQVHEMAMQGTTMKMSAAAIGGEYEGKVSPDGNSITGKDGIGF